MNAIVLAAAPAVLRVGLALALVAAVLVGMGEMENLLSLPHQLAVALGKA